MTDLPKKSDGWALIADYIINKEQGDAWRSTEDSSESISFTRWGLEQAKAIGISKYSFWQFRRAGLLYNMMIELLPKEHRHPLRELSDVTPENLNELQKIWRVAPPEMFKDLFERVVVHRNITRKKLRSIWASLRPAMSGETARGRQSGKSFDIRINEGNENAQSELINGLVMVAIKIQIEELFGNDREPIIVDCREQYRPRESGMVDALVFCRKNPKDPHNFLIETHGISLGWPRDQIAISQINVEKPAFPCDKLWLVYAHRENQEIKGMENIPDYVGIIEAEIDTDKGAVSSLKMMPGKKSGCIEHLHEHTISLMASAYKTRSLY